MLKLVIINVDYQHHNQQVIIKDRHSNLNNIIIFLINVKIKKKYSWILFAFFMSLTMSFSISFVLTLINAGLISDFLSVWVRGFIIGFIVALPIALIVVPLMRRVVDRITID